MVKQNWAMENERKCVKGDNRKGKKTLLALTRWTGGRTLTNTLLWYLRMLRGTQQLLHYSRQQDEEKGFVAGGTMRLLLCKILSASNVSRRLIVSFWNWARKRTKCNPRWGRKSEIKRENNQREATNKALQDVISVRSFRRKEKKVIKKGTKTTFCIKKH